MMPLFKYFKNEMLFVFAFVFLFSVTTYGDTHTADYVLTSGADHGEPLYITLNVVFDSAGEFIYSGTTYSGSAGDVVVLDLSYTYSMAQYYWESGWSKDYDINFTLNDEIVTVYSFTVVSGVKTTSFAAEYWTVTVHIDPGGDTVYYTHTKSIKFSNNSTSAKTFTVKCALDDDEENPTYYVFDDVVLSGASNPLYPVEATYSFSCSSTNSEVWWEYSSYTGTLGEDALDFNIVAFSSPTTSSAITPADTEDSSVPSLVSDSSNLSVESTAVDAVNVSDFFTSSDYSGFGSTTTTSTTSSASSNLSAAEVAMGVGTGIKYAKETITAAIQSGVSSATDSIIEAINANSNATASAIASEVYNLVGGNASASAIGSAVSESGGFNADGLDGTYSGDELNANGTDGEGGYGDEFGVSASATNSVATGNAAVDFAQDWFANTWTLSLPSGFGSRQSLTINLPSLPSKLSALPNSVVLDLSKFDCALVRNIGLFVLNVSGAFLVARIFKAAW
jgi:hypothetical protein